MFESRRACSYTDLVSAEKSVEGNLNGGYGVMAAREIVVLLVRVRIPLATPYLGDVLPCANLLYNKGL